MLPEPTDAAREVFGAELAVATTYVAALAGDGVGHGHIGPREIPRLWSRHLVNGALVTDLLPLDARVIDVGSGAGLPGLPMAIRRPDLRVTLVEPMQRRVDFLQRCVTELGLEDRVQVVRGRAESGSVRSGLRPEGWVVARAVAPLGRLVGWCLPLVGPGAQLLAIKGANASAEIAEHAAAIASAGAKVVDVVEIECGGESTRVVAIEPSESDVRSSTRVGRQARYQPRGQ